MKISDTPIRRHIKIKSQANPHDTNWNEYFESRWGQKMRVSQNGRQRLHRVWRNQEGLCPLCRERITHHTPWRVSFKVKRTDGGTDAASNLSMLHVNCHRNKYLVGKTDVV